jgi:hypothetical protein
MAAAQPVAPTAPIPFPAKEYVLDITNCSAGSLEEDKLLVMRSLKEHILCSNAETEDFSIPMCVPEVWDAMIRPANAITGFIMEFYSDQLDEPSCPIPARRSGKSIASAIRKCDPLYKLIYMLRR